MAGFPSQSLTPVGLLSGPFNRLLKNRTQLNALTVAGQWRIFTAFPNIPLRDSDG